MSIQILARYLFVLMGAGAAFAGLAVLGDFPRGAFSEGRLWPALFAVALGILVLVAASQARR